MVQYLSKLVVVVAGLEVECVDSGRLHSRDVLEVACRGHRNRMKIPRLTVGASFARGCKAQHKIKSPNLLPGILQRPK